jgi:CHAT domain-containing protein
VVKVKTLFLTCRKKPTTYRAIEMTDLLGNLRMKDLEINFLILSEKEKEKYFATMQKDFDILFDFSLHHSQLKLQTEKAYNNALLTKGLTLKSSTAMRSAIQNSGDTILINEYDNWLTLKKKIANLNETDSTYKELVTQANEMERELVKTSTIFSDFDKVKNIKWQDVQSSLKPNEASIEFVHFKSEIDTANPIIYAALIIKKDSKHPEMIKLCTEADLKEILGVFQGNNMGFVKKVYGTRSKAEKALYEKIWQPIEKHLEGIQNIYYSPSGLLHKVSFAAISKDNNVFLCDNYQLHQRSSTGKVALPSNVMYDTKDAYLLMGGVQYNTDKTKKEIWNYLPGTLNETDNIQSFLEKKKHSVNFLAANDANETNFKTQAQKANVLHISTHGFFYPDPEQVREEVKKNEVKEENIIFRGTEALDSAERSSSLYANWSFVINKNPLMRSGLVLAGANDVWQRNALEEGEDGILTAQEVSNLDLRNTKLVVLSACETGLGDIKGSEGVFGLQRAFKMAGAEYLIMSLWQVPDKETAEFMELFYKNLVKLKNIPKAFNLTQQVMRKKYDPYYWAAFVLIN